MFWCKCYASFNYCINMDFESVNKRCIDILLSHSKQVQTTLLIIYVYLYFIYTPYIYNNLYGIPCTFSKSLVTLKKTQQKTLFMRTKSDSKRKMEQLKELYYRPVMDLYKKKFLKYWE